MKFSAQFHAENHAFEDIFFKNMLSETCVFSMLISSQMFLFCCTCDVCKGMCHFYRVIGTSVGVMVEGTRHSKAVRVELELVPCAVFYGA